MVTLNGGVGSGYAGQPPRCAAVHPAMNHRQRMWCSQRQVGAWVIPQTVSGRRGCEQRVVVGGWGTQQQQMNCCCCSSPLKIMHMGVSTQAYRSSSGVAPPPAPVLRRCSCMLYKKPTLKQEGGQCLAAVLARAKKKLHWKHHSGHCFRLLFSK